MKKKQRLPILRVVQFGKEFERYSIEDENAQVWNGQKFGQSGIVYANHNHAAIDVQAILKSNFEGIDPQRFVVPLYVETLSHDRVTVAEVAQYLSRASRLFLNTTDHGNGPDGSLVLPWIDWSRIKQIKEFPND